MVTAGIIAEYNPFHNGHAYHIARTREFGCSHIAVVMSGCFTQRGEAAIMGKAARCRAALMGGADLVLELPVPWATASAEGFACGAVAILNALGCVDLLSFGSECGDVNKISECARLALKADGSPALAAQLKAGHSFPRARELAMGEISSGGDLSPLRSPNDTLAVEYVKALIKTGSQIRPAAVARLAAGHDAPEPRGDIASASFIRDLLSRGMTDEACRYLPGSTADILRDETAGGRVPFQYNLASLLMLAHLRRLGPEDFTRLPDVREGIENRIYKALQTARSVEELQAAVKTKRYTLSRIRRILLYAWLGLDREILSSPPPYIRVLGFNERGREVLRRAKKSATLPIVTRCADIEGLPQNAKRVFEWECLAGDLYGLCLSAAAPAGAERKYRPIRLNS